MQKVAVRERARDRSLSSFDLLGKRWSALIVQALDGGPRRFREVLGDLGRINDKVLSQRLKELEVAGIITRHVYTEVPVRVEYALTEKGRALVSIVREMERWDSAWTPARPAPAPRLSLLPEVKLEPPAVLAQQAPAPPPAPLAAVPPAAVLTPQAAPPPAAGAPPPAPSAPPERPQSGIKGFWKRLGL